ncbi:MAG: decaprenyl-phosphate phosphoribosyltransferase [Spirochaetales bacterium]|nr:decaprenyl-phosphate phosphoribosyltransferase [Spirochaetales bacterium]
MLALIRLLRPHQYVKNLFVFLPVFFALQIFELTHLLEATVAFLCFSAVASAHYVFNDYMDREEDRKHPTKKNRPLAAGTVRADLALTLAAILFIGATVASFLFSYRLALLLLFYLLINVAYSIKLKHLAVLDVMTIAFGFVLRLMAGSVVTGIPLSPWIVVITFLLALFLALAKRRDDVLIFIEKGERTRPVIDGYNLEFLNAAMVLGASITIVGYIMYTLSPAVVNRLGSDRLYLTVFFVIGGIMRYLQITFVEKRSGSPTEILLKDGMIQLSLAGWILTFAALIYMHL